MGHVPQRKARLAAGGKDPCKVKGLHKDYFFPPGGRNRTYNLAAVLPLINSFVRFPAGMGKGNFLNSHSIMQGKAKSVQ